MALSLIRKGTYRLHAKLDKHSAMSSLSNRSCKLESYQQAMQGLAIAYHDADGALLASRVHCPEELETYQPRLPLILSDLSAMGLKQPMPHPAGLCSPSSRAAYLGMRYVVEGAQLGGRLIERNLAQSDIAPTLMHAKQFWSSPITSKNCWPTLLSLLDKLHERNDLADAISTARRTFHHFVKCLSIQQEH